MLAQLQGGAQTESSDRATSSATESRAKGGVSRALGMLDIVVSIVGEVFGQRDLLDERMSW